MGAREIIALNLMDFRDVMVEENGFGPFLGKLFNIVEQRQLVLETALAEARGAKVYRLDLCGKTHVPLWQFEFTDELMMIGYETARKELGEGILRPLVDKPGWIARAARAIRLRMGGNEQKNRLIS
jgi:hypothetical protein